MISTLLVLASLMGAVGVVLAAAAVICCLGSTPLILRALNVHLEPVAATSSNGIGLVGAKAATVPLPKVAQPTGTGKRLGSLLRLA